MPIFAFLCVVKVSKVSCEIETKLETHVNDLLHFPPAISRPTRRFPFFSKRRRPQSGDRELSEAILTPCSVFVLLLHFRPLSVSGDGSEKLGGMLRAAPPSPTAAAYANRIIGLASGSGQRSGLTFTSPPPCQPAQVAALAGQMQRYGCGREARGPPYKNVLGGGVYGTQSALRA